MNGNHHSDEVFTVYDIECLLLLIAVIFAVCLLLAGGSVMADFMTAEDLRRKYLAKHPGNMTDIRYIFEVGEHETKKTDQTT